MRTVYLVTRHPDAAQLGSLLERSGFSAPAIAPERLAEDDAPEADAVVLDLRDIPPNAFYILTQAYRERGTVLLALVAEGHLERLAADTPTDDFLVLPASPAELARRVEWALWRTASTRRISAVAL
jgi:DNA-binding response OmpR family regulator